MVDFLGRGNLSMSFGNSFELKKKDLECIRKMIPGASIEVNGKNYLAIGKVTDKKSGPSAFRSGSDFYSVYNGKMTLVIFKSIKMDASRIPKLTQGDSIEIDGVEHYSTSVLPRVSDLSILGKGGPGVSYLLYKGKVYPNIPKNF